MPKVTVSKDRMISYINTMLKTDKVWAIRALVLIYKNQTPAEQVNRATTDHNNIGFTGVDANFLSSLAEKYERYKDLTPGQMVWVHKLMPKYAGQILKKTDKVKLVAKMLNAQLITAEEHNGFMGDILAERL